MSLRLSHCCISGALAEIEWIGKKYPKYRKKLRYVPTGAANGKPPYWCEASKWPLFFLSVGGLSWKKNQEITLDVFGIISKSLPEARLFLVGTGVHGVLQPVVRRGLENVVANIGNVDFDEMDHWFRWCPYLISSSRYEGAHSLAILEAMSYGAIAFVSPIPPTTEIIHDFRNGIVLSGISAQSNAEKMMPILTNQDGNLLLRKQASQTAARNRWERQIGRLNRIIVCSNT
jgi:glycosyltransferase involved in cell wall biosynthesis